jgi:glycosyltransferase involved in cell wall biosynthesis
MRRQGKALEAFLSEGGFDCVILAYGYAPNPLRFPQVSACRRIVYIEGDLALVQADAARKAAKALPAKIIKEIRYRQISRNYRDFLGKIGTFFIYTRTEISEVNRRFPAVKTMQLTMGMELAGIIPLPPSQEAGVAGFLGNFQHPPNPDAVHWYLEKVHPILVARHPDYRLLIAGMNIPRGIAEKAETDRALILLGPVEALETFYRVVSFTVNPIVSGKGIRTKVLESAAYGRAIVSTTLGADGTDPLEVLIGDGPEAFAECCSRFLARPAAQAAIDRNRKIVEARFSGSAVLERLLG